MSDQNTSEYRGLVRGPPRLQTFEPRVSVAGLAGTKQKTSNTLVNPARQPPVRFHDHPQEPLIPRPSANTNPLIRPLPYPVARYCSAGEYPGRFHEHLSDSDTPTQCSSRETPGCISFQQSASAHQGQGHRVNRSCDSLIGSPGPSVPLASDAAEPSSRGVLGSLRRLGQINNDENSQPRIRKESIGRPQPTNLSPFRICDFAGGQGQEPNLYHHPLPESPLRPGARRGHSTGSISSAIKRVFNHSKNKSGDVDTAEFSREQKSSSHLRKLSKSIGKLKLRSKSDPSDKRSFGRFGSEAPFYQPSPLFFPNDFSRSVLGKASAPYPLQTTPSAPVSALKARQTSNDGTNISQECLLPPVPEALRRFRGYSLTKIRFPRPQDLTMDPPRASRFLDPSSAMAAITKHKAEAIKLAKEQAVAVQDMCRRAKTETPPYEFEELIGKGAYGRVYKGHQLPSRKVVAIKVLDIDAMDYKSLRDFKDESIKDFIHETKVMKQVKDAGAKNINEIIEAISIHSQLWLVCEYCPGGSVRTLMRATGDRLDEKFLIPVARELAEGLRAIHEAGIIHRDIKAANVLIHEEGHLQICDFGVAGVLQSQKDKRSTWIGTPHWMPPEMFTTRGEAHKYGSEVDVWAFGCTLIEFATGNPPNSNLRERMQIGRQLNRNTPKLDSDKYTEGLQNLVQYVLEPSPATRPSMAEIQEHPYIAGSEEAYPTSSLRELVRIYYQWSQRGGQRISLFHPGGAAAAEAPGDESEVEEDWNFSTTDGFERRFSVIDLDQIAASLAELEPEISPSRPAENDTMEEPVQTAMTEEDKANFDERVRRGAEAMEGLFNEEKPSYRYETKNDFVPVEPKQPVSDLPLRMETDRSSVTSTFIDIDIGSFDSSHYAAGATSAQPFQLADADTIKANRSSGRQRNSNEDRSRSSSSDVGSERESQDLTFQPQSGPRPPTMDWKFPVFMQAPEDESAAPDEVSAEEFEPETQLTQKPEHATVPPTETEPESHPDLSDRRATMEWTFPVMTASNDDQDGPDNNATDYNRYSTLRAPLTALQEPSTTIRPPSIGEPGDSRPSTSNSAESSVSATSEADYDPFRFDRPSTPPNASPPTHERTSSDEFPVLESPDDNSDHERSSVLDGPGPDEEDTPVWHESTGPSRHSASHSEPFPTALASKDPNMNSPFPTIEESPMSEPLPTARRDPPVTVSGIHAMEPIQFPELLPPRLEVLTNRADENAVGAELDRLLGDFLGALSATGEALSRTHVGAENGHDSNSTLE